MCFLNYRTRLLPLHLIKVKFAAKTVYQDLFARLAVVSKECFQVTLVDDMHCQSPAGCAENEYKQDDKAHFMFFKLPLTYVVDELIFGVIVFHGRKYIR